MIGKELRDTTNTVREKLRIQERIKLEREWLIDLCQIAAEKGLDHISPNRLEDAMPTNLSEGSLWDWCRTEGIQMSGSKMNNGTYYTFYW